MATIIPAILESTSEGVAQKLLHALDFATDVQVDVVDGVFSHPATWPYHEGLMTQAGPLAPFTHADKISIELDLMVDDPERTLTTWMNLGARRIVLHLESTLNMKSILQTLAREYGHDKGFMTDSLAVGIAINIDTHLELLEPYIDSIDYVQFMGIKRIGVQGQSFAPEVLHKIEVFRAKHPEIPIQVDGGVTLESAPKLLALGVSRLVTGSAIWGSDNPAETYHALEELTQEHGLYGKW